MKPRILVLTLGALLSTSACSVETRETGDPDPVAGKGASVAGSSGAGAGAGGKAGGSTTGGSSGSGAGPAGAGGTGAGTGGGGGAGLGGSAGAGGAANAGAGSGMGGNAGSGGSAGGGSDAGGGGGTSGSSAGGGSGPGGTGGTGGTGAVENSTADCQVPALKEPSALSENSKLPDPFIRLDGTRLSKKSEWRCRRQEIIKQAEKYIYGEKPAFDTVTGTVTQTKITVHVEALGKAIDFSANVKLPSTGQAPYPAIINIGASGMTLGESRILEQGVAIIYYNHYDLGKEGTPEQSRGQPNPGKFYDIYGGNHSAGLLMAWAWGASRLIDVIQQAGGDVIDSASLGVTGCSRNGKGAFAVGVFDERIALTIPHETSTAGVPAYRIVDVLNTERTDHNYFGLNWLSNDFEPFVYANGRSNAVKLPIDSHSLVASLAPRGILVLENPHQTQMSAPAGHTAVVAGSEVYKALGVLGNLSYHSNVAQTPHCSYKDEYTELLLQNIARFLKHTGDAPGRIEASSEGMLRLSDWIDWEAPTLTDD